MYTIRIFNPETGEMDVVITTDYTIQISSSKYNEKVIFETDDQEFNGE